MLLDSLRDEDLNLGFFLALDFLSDVNFQH